MSTATAQVLLGSRPDRSVVVALAVQEARRLLRHPMTLLGFGVFGFNAVLSVLHDEGPRTAFETVSMMPAFYPGLTLVLAANLVATRDKRAGSDELLAPAPARRAERVLAQLLAALAPALVGLLLVAVLHGIYLVDERYALTYGMDHIIARDDAVPTLWHLLGGVFALLGACAFGTMLAVWAPWRGAAVVGVVALVAGTLALEPVANGPLFGPAMSWARWGLYGDMWAGMNPGSPGWHVLYLAGLCAMAGSAALLRVADRRRVVVVVGVASVLLAVLAGAAQLP